MRNRTILIVSILILSLILSACGVASAQGDNPTPTAQPGTNLRTLSVSGSGKVYLTPDIAYINIGVHTEGKDAAEAVASNNTQSQEVTEALTQAGVDAKDIQTINFSIYPQQQFDENGRPTGEVTYIVDNTVYVTVRNLEDIGDLLDAAVSAGANSINGIQFDVADKSAAQSEAREAAMADAQTQAQELAQAAGVELGAVQAIQAGGAVLPPTPFFEGKGGAIAQEAASVPVSPGQMTITENVSVTYEIR